MLLVYGEQRANAALAGELELDGYQVHRASHVGTLQARLNAGEVDLVIFGHSPHCGLDVLRALRAGDLAPGVSGVRVLWMGTCRKTTSVLRAFEAGSDDVTRTPLDYAELLARVQALLRRYSLIDSRAVLRYGPLEINVAARMVTFGGARIELRRLEFSLLVHLARDPTRVHEKRDLLREVWGYRDTGATRTVASHASRIRRKLAGAGAEGWVCSARGVGYRLAPEIRTAPLSLGVLLGGPGSDRPRNTKGEERPVSVDTTRGVGSHDLLVLGQAIFRLREQRGVSAGELAASIGVDRQRVYELEAGKFDPPYDLLVALAKRLGVRISALVVYAEER